MSVKHYDNSHFYDASGKFLPEVAKAAYFEMMEAHGYPIPQILRDGLWVSDFSQGDFAHCGMGGIFWANEVAYGYFAHEIYLLPGQMIAEHRHESAPTTGAKMESWHVRHGSIFAYGEDGDTPPAGYEIPASQKATATVSRGRLVQQGEVARLNRQTARHFMVAGPDGAIVSEYGMPHDGEGLRFSNETVVF